MILMPGENAEIIVGGIMLAALIALVGIGGEHIVAYIWAHLSCGWK